MNEASKAGEIFKMAELVPYAEGKIVNMDVVHNDKMKFVVMAFDEGTGLSEHAAPGEALIFALDGEGVIGYEGTDHEELFNEMNKIRAGGMVADKIFQTGRRIEQFINVEIKMPQGILPWGFLRFYPLIWISVD